jgi:hypothetical protein
MAKKTGYQIAKASEIFGADNTALIRQANSNVFESNVVRVMMQMLGYTARIPEVCTKSALPGGLLSLSVFVQQCGPFAFPVTIISARRTMKLPLTSLFGNASASPLYKQWQKAPDSLTVIPVTGFTTAGGIAVFKPASLTALPESSVFISRTPMGVITAAALPVMLRYLVRTGDIRPHDED